MLVSVDAVGISTKCEDHVCQPDVKVVFDEAGEFRDHFNGEVLNWSLKINGTNKETTRIEKTGVPTRRHKSKKPWTQWGHPHQRVQQIQEKSGQVESRDTR